MNIMEDFLAVSDQDGLIQPGIGQGSFNGLLYTGEAVIVLSDNNALDPFMRQRCLAAIILCERLPGLMSRCRRGNDDQEGPDDYHGVAVASVFLDDGAIAKRIVDRGREGVTQWRAEYEDANKLKLSKFVYSLLSLGGRKPVKWVYNNHNPGFFTLSAWLGRMPGLIADLKLAAKETPTPIEYLAWIVGIAIMFFKKQPDTDAFLLPWCSMRIARKRSLLLRPFAALGMLRLRRVWGSVGALVKHYFNNPNHPTGVYSKE